MTASFFDYDVTIGAFRYIVLTSSAPVVEAMTCSEDEEGWSRTACTWTLDGDRVVHTVYRDGRDCDGRYSSDDVYSCPVSDLAASIPGRTQADEENGTPPHPFKVPVWTEGRRSQRDYTAEAAGY